MSRPARTRLPSSGFGQDVWVSGMSAQIGAAGSICSKMPTTRTGTGPYEPISVKVEPTRRPTAAAAGRATVASTMSAEAGGRPSTIRIAWSAPVSVRTDRLGVQLPRNGATAPAVRTPVGPTRAVYH